MMNIFERILNKIVSYRINYKVFPKHIAKQMPIYTSYNVKYEGLYKGCIELDSNNIYKGMIQIGFPRIAPGLKNGSNKSLITFVDGGKIVFGGKADLSQGISISVFRNATLTIGEGIYTNGYCSILCKEEITIGKNNKWGWNVFLVDGDGHPIWNSEKKLVNENRPIKIGDDVWLGAYTKVLKGSEVRNGCIVGLGSIVTSKNENEKAIIVGNPANEIKKGFSWSREELVSNKDGFFV